MERTNPQDSRFRQRKQRGNENEIREKLSSELMSLVDFYEIEFHEVVTKEKLDQRNL